MNYTIVNSGGNLYIRLDGKGRVITCPKNFAQNFTYAKACNVLSCLPRHLHKFGFRVMKSDEIIEKKVLTNEDYQVPEVVNQWMDKVKNFQGLIEDAKARREDLTNELSNVDRELSNCLHEIELTKNKNACDGYKAYKQMKKILAKRRKIKDEYSIVSSISMSNVSNLYANVKHIVDVLEKRKFIIRETEFVFDDEN